MLKTITRNMSIAYCLLLSWNVLIYALETLFVASDSTPSHINDPRIYAGEMTVSLPANVRFPLRVKLVLIAPVPA